MHSIFEKCAKDLSNLRKRRYMDDKQQIKRIAGQPSIRIEIPKIPWKVLVLEFQVWNKFELRLLLDLRFDSTPLSSALDAIFISSSLEREHILRRLKERIMTFAQFFENAWRRPLNNNFLASIGSFYVAYKFLQICWFAVAFVLKLLVLPPRKVTVTIEKDELADKLEGLPKFDTKKLIGEQKTVFLWDPSTLDYFGETPAMNAEEVKVNQKDCRGNSQHYHSHRLPDHKLQLMSSACDRNLRNCAHSTLLTISPGCCRPCSCCTAYMEKLNFCKAKTSHENNAQIHHRKSGDLRQSSCSRVWQNFSWCSHWWSAGYLWEACLASFFRRAVPSSWEAWHWPNDDNEEGACWVRSFRCHRCYRPLELSISQRLQSCLSSPILRYS